MYRKRSIIGVSVVLVAVGGGVAYAASDAPSITTAESVTLQAQQGPTTFVPVPGQTGQRPVTGDQILFTEQLRRDGQPAGSDQVDCTVNGGALVCTAVFDLHDGTISVIGKVPLNGPGNGGTTLGVTGGTGRYQNARGQVRVRSTGPSTETEVFNLIP
jgi:hypothetical protein